MASTSSELIVTFPGGRRVDAELGGHVVRTDQPRTNGGEDSAPSPLNLFLAAIGTCAGLYVSAFCQRRDLPTDGVRVRQRNHFDPETGVLARVELDIEVPPSFPEKYRDALVRAADGCAVKKAVQTAPLFDVKTVVAG